ncbi:reverse transcriptase Ty1/copia-type domain-containing protein [Citrus sinensis]|nr:reverse transcriptase Ty1/copia-type domain-containing protein [Citrus sinensis]
MPHHQSMPRHRAVYVNSVVNSNVVSTVHMNSVIFPFMLLLRSKWVYRIKYINTGAIERFKAWLVAKWFTQVPGIDYEETFSPVIKHTIIRLVLALAVNLSWSMKKLDMRNAFLHGHLNETVYMEQPLGFVNPKLPLHAKYARDLLNKIKMQDSTVVATPMAVKEVPRFDDAQPVNATEYRQVVGSLQYLTFTRPDITHTVNKVCQKFQQPTKADLRAVKRILRYLTGTLNFGLRYLKQSSLTLYGFSDSDWAGCPLTRRSTSGFCIYLGSNCISWSLKKQTTVAARSSAEPEYRCMASTAVKLTWLTYIFKKIGITLIKPPVLICDNISALHMSKNHVFHARTKHIELDYHFVREKVTSGLLNTRYIPSSQ